MKDLSRFKEEFFSEAADHLDIINKLLLELEKNPKDRSIITGIFRSAHTLKGNGNTMGFVKFSELAHSIEGLLSSVRDNRTVLTQAVTDSLFEAVDALQDGLKLLEDEGNENNFDSASIIKKLNELDVSKINHNEDHSLNAHITLEDQDWERINNAKGQNKNVFRIVGAFDSQCKIKFAKALLLLRELTNNSDILKSNPSQDDIKTGKLGMGVEFVISTDQSVDEFNSVIANLSGFDHIDVLPLDSTYDRQKLEKIEKEKVEHEKHQISERNKNEAIKNVQSVKISINRLDHLMNLVGELLINNMRIQNISRNLESKDLREVVEGFNRLVTDIQEEVMSQRMIPIGQIFDRFPRMIRDLSKKEKKNVNIVIEGEEIEFDRTVLDEIGDPLVHLLRNCVDHGIETMDDRVNNGKPDSGVIQLKASRRKNSAVIEIIDDGKGIDPSSVKAAALKKAMITQEEADLMSETELMQLIFKPGLSTNEFVTDVSGRGVGMDVVESKVRSIGGMVRLDSTLGKGTRVTLELPLTLAIVSALLVKIGDETYALQLNQVDRVVMVNKNEIKTIQGNESFVLQDLDIPLINLSKELNCPNPKDNERLTVVVVEKHESKIGFIVDSIISQQQILIKPLDELVKGTKGIAGAMILGGGDIGLILDIGAFT